MDEYELINYRFKAMAIAIHISNDINELADNTDAVLKMAGFNHGERLPQADSISQKE